MCHVLLISLTSATQPPGKCKGLASVAQPPGKCLESVALRPAISDGLPLSVLDVRIFEMILWGSLKIKQKRCQKELVLAVQTHTGMGSPCGYGFWVNKSEG